MSDKNIKVLLMKKYDNSILEISSEIWKIIEKSLSLKGYKFEYKYMKTNLI